MHQIVFMRKHGALLVVETLDTELRRILEKVLTYDKILFLRGWKAKELGKHVEVRKMACYRYKSDPHGVMPTVLVTASGYVDSIAAALRKAGYRPMLRDVTPTNRASVFVPDWSRVEHVRWKWMQRETLEALVARDMARVCCPTGWGKSFLIKALATILPSARIDITTHSVSVIKQLYDDLRSQLPSVGFVGGGKKVYDQRVMCYSGKSLHHSDGKADILIVDEAHEFATADYMDRIGRYRLSRRYCFSANDIGDRADGADFELLGAFGPVVVNIPYQEAVEHGCIVPIEVKWNDVFCDVNPTEGYSNDTERMRHGIWRNERRNQIIAETAREYVDDQVLIVVATVEHAVYLKKLLPEFTMCYRQDGMSERDRAKYVNWGLINDDEPRMTDVRRYQLKEEFSNGTLKKAIATSIWNRGVDFQQLAVLIRGDAQNTAIADTQIPGRVSRKHDESGKQVGVVIDFRDQFDKRFYTRAKDRQARYESKGWTQIFPDYNKRLSQFVRTQ